MANQFIASVECALQNSHGEFLIIKRPGGVHAAGLLAFPGGGVEYTDGAPDNNILIEAIKREVFEEVGLKLLDKLEYLTTSYFLDQQNRPIMHTVFFCKLNQTKITLNVSPREVPEYYWLTTKDILQAANCPPWLKRYLSLIEQYFTNK